MSKKFFSNELSAIKLEADPVISSHLSTLDRVSNDIKTLEATLREAAIPFTFIYIFFSEEQYVNDRESYPDLHTRVYSYDDHCLVWHQTMIGTRLSYNIYGTKKEYSSNNKEIGDPLRPFTILKSSTPLVETKALFRLDIEKELPYFYKGIIEKLKLDKKQDFYFLRSPLYNKKSSSEETNPKIEANYEFLGITPPKKVTTFVSLDEIF